MRAQVISKEMGGAKHNSFLNNANQRRHVTMQHYNIDSYDIDTEFQFKFIRILLVEVDGEV